MYLFYLDICLHLLIFACERTNQVECWNNKVYKYAWVEDKKQESYLGLTSFELSAQLMAQSWIQVHDHKLNNELSHQTQSFV